MRSCTTSKEREKDETEWKRQKQLESEEKHAKRERDREECFLAKYFGVRFSWKAAWVSLG